jgi:hypothetical protein
VFPLRETLRADEGLVRNDYTLGVAMQTNRRLE